VVLIAALTGPGYLVAPLDAGGQFLRLGFEKRIVDNFVAHF
jgi:hypothetical protein